MNPRQSRPGSGSSRASGRPSGPRRPRGGSDVFPLITGVVGSSILAFSLYALSHKPEIKEPEYVHGTTYNNENNNYCENCPVNTSYQSNESDDYTTIRTEKRKWLTELEQQVVKEQNVRQELLDQMQKVSELSEQLQRECALREKLEKERQTGRHKN